MVVAAGDSRIELSAEEQAWLAQHPEIVLGATTEYPPLVIRSPDGTHTGVMVDLYAEVNRLLGTKIRLHIEDPWSEVQDKAQNREIDGLVLGGRSASREALYLATDTLFPTYFSVFASNQGEDHIKSFSDLDGMRIGYKLGAGATKHLLGKLPSAILTTYPSHETLTQAQLSNEVDVIVAWISYDHWRKAKMQGTIDNIFLIDEYPIEMVTHVRKDWPELVSILNKAIAALQKDAFPRIINKWFGEQPESQVETKVPLTLEEQAWLKQKNTVRVRIVDWPPYLIVKDNEPPQGIVIDYLKIIEERTGVRFKFEVTDQSFAEFLESMKQKQGPDMTAVIMPTLEREEFLSFSESYISSPYVIFIREQETPILDINALIGKTVAVPRGFVLQQELANGYPEIRQLLVDSDELALQAVATGRADAYIGNLTVASHIIHKLGFANLKVTSPSPFGEQSLSMGSRKDWPEITSILDKALLSITDEKKRGILSKYLAIKYERGIDKTEILKWVLIVGIGFLGIIALFIFWNKQLSSKVIERTAELSDSEARFRGIFEQAAVGIAHIATDGQFLRLNQKFCDIVGYSQDEMKNLTFQEITHPDDIVTDLNLVNQLIGGRKDSYSLEKRYIHKDSSIVWVNLTVKIVRKGDGTPRWFVSVVEDISKRKEAEQKVLEHQQRLKAQASQLTLVEDRERRRIATDLHDNVGQSLALSRLQLAAASNAVEDDALKEQFDEISQTLLSAVKDARHLIFELSSPTLHELGLGAAISEWVEYNIKLHTGLDLEVIDKLDLNCFSLDQNTIMFRSVRELLTNIVKYARADKASVLLEQEGSVIRITVKDNGIGFNPEQIKRNVSNEGGLGLFSIEERMSDFGGSMVIDSRAHHGTTIVLTAPCSLEEIT